MNINSVSVDILFIFISIGSILFSIALLKFIPINHSLLPFSNFGAYLPYFLMGVITYIFKDKYNKLFINISKNRSIISLGVMISALILIYYSDSGIFNLMFRSIAKYYSLILALYVLYRFLNRTNKLLRYLADSSYSVYLLHQPVIVIVSYYILTYIDATPFISLISILLTSILVTYLLDFLIIRKTKIGKFLFTGVKPKQLPQKKQKSSSCLS